MSVKLFLGDCLEVMKEIPDNSIDLILCDLPYGTTACKWDSIIPFEPLWGHYNRIAKPTAAIVLTASQPFTSALVMSNPKMFKYAWVWEKNKGTGHLNAGRMPMKYHEDICVFSKGPTTYNPQITTGHRPMNRATNKQNNIYGRHGSVESGGATTRKPRSIIKCNVVNNDGSSGARLNPTQKPVELMEYLIRTYTNEGEIVLDNCMGSGSTGVACINTGRSFIGIEYDEDQFYGAANRIDPAGYYDPLV